jgi:ABC-type glycerol-3-phosphate transport system substrate-binding protein
MRRIRWIAALGALLLAGCGSTTTVTQTETSTQSTTVTVHQGRYK